MKVRELIKALERLDQNAPVDMSLMGAVSAVGRVNVVRPADCNGTVVLLGKTRCAFGPPTEAMLDAADDADQNTCPPPWSGYS